MFSSRPSRRRQIIPVIEMLEVRRMRSADLSGVFSSGIPAALETGDRNHLAIEVVNQGDSSAAGKVMVNLFASADPSGGDNVLLGSVTRRMNLKPDGGSKVNFHFAEPTTLPDGTYSLIASVDSSAVPNVTTTNDMIVSSSTVSVQRPAADLTAEMVVAPTQPIIINGDSVQGQPASVKLINRGNAPADGLVSVDFYLSGNSILDSQSQFAGGLPYVAVNLKPGHSEVFRTSLEPAINTPGGEYFLFADATPESGIIQKNIGDEVGLAPQQVDIIRTMPVATAAPAASQDASQDYTGAPIECPAGGTGTVQTPASDAAAVTPSTPPADNSAPACDTSSDCNTSSDCSTPSCDDASQSGDDSQTQPDQSTDDATQPSTDDSTQPSNDDTTQPSTDSSSADPSQPTTDNSQDDSSQQTDNSTDTSASSTDDSSEQTDSSGDTSDSSIDDSSQSTDSSGDTSDPSTDDSSQSSDSGSDDSSDDSYADPGF